MIRLENVTARKGRFALDSVSLELDAGGYGVVIGPAGSGKTTLLEVIAGYDARDAVSLPMPPRRFDAAPGPLKGLRIAASVDLGFAAVAPAVRAAFAKVVAVLADLGADVQELTPSLGTQLLEEVLQPIGFCEQASAVMFRSPADMDWARSQDQCIRNGRCAACTPTSFALGRPSLVITTSSPRAVTSNRLESWSFAARTFTTRVGLSRTAASWRTGLSTLAGG